MASIEARLNLRSHRLPQRHDRRQVVRVVLHVVEVAHRRERGLHGGVAFCFLQHRKIGVVFHAVADVMQANACERVLAGVGEEAEAERLRGLEGGEL